MSRTAGLATPIRGPAASGAASWQGSVKDKDLTAPPGSPTLGDRYIVASPATGLWSGEEDSIAEWDGDEWLFDAPAGGWAVWVDDEDELYVYNGSAWAQESFGPHAATHKGGGADAIDAASSSVAGLMSGPDKAKLDASIAVIKTSDDIEAILEAASDGGSFWLEDGTHTTLGLITIANKKGISIRGGPGAIVTRSGSDQLFKIEGCEDFHMSGFTLAVTSAGNAVVYVDNAGAGPYQYAARHNYVDLHFEIGGTAGIWSAILAGGQFTQGSIRDCTFFGDIGDCISVTGANVEGTIIAKNRMVTTAAGFGNGIDVSTTGGRGVLIIGNDIEGPWYIGINTNDSEGVIACSNRLRGVQRGMKIGSSADRAIAAHNIVYDSAGYGIQTVGDYGIIHGNEIYSAADDGIQLIGSEQTHVTDNMMENGAAWGMDVDSASLGCSFANNHFFNNASGDLNIQGTNEHTVDGKINNRRSTTDATVTTIATISIPDDTVVWIETNIIARRTDVAGRGKWKRGVLAYREAAGAAAIEGGVWTPLTIKSAIPSVWDVDIIESGNNVLIQVTGAAAQSLNWSSQHTVEERS